VSEVHETQLTQSAYRARRAAETRGIMRPRIPRPSTQICLRGNPRFTRVPPATRLGPPCPTPDLQHYGRRPPGGSALWLAVFRVGQIAGAGILASSLVVRSLLMRVTCTHPCLSAGHDSHDRWRVLVVVR
jgi:hypothetical protein